MSEQGWIKLHRKMVNSACFNDPNPWTLRVWIECLLQANHSESKVLRNGREITIEPGQFLYSRTAWAKRMKIPQSTLRNVIERLQNWDMLEDSIRDNGLATIFKVKNWDKYQSKDSYEDSLRTASGQPQDTSKNDKKGRREETGPIPPTPQGVEDGKGLAELPGMRPEVKEVWDYWEMTMAPITKNQVFQRNAISGLLNRHGLDTVKKMVRVAAAAHVQEYTPNKLKVGSPKQLEDRWDELVIWARSMTSKQTINPKSY